MAADCGSRIVEMVWANLLPSQVATREAFENAITVDMALGGSTNAIIHLVAMAARLGVAISLNDFDRISRRTPVIANIRPSGEYLMEDFFYAGGLPALMNEIGGHLHLNCLTVNGKSIGENIAGAAIIKPDVIRKKSEALSPTGGTVILRGSLAPDGAVLKTSAASPALLRHTGAAVVFENLADMEARINHPDLNVTAGSVLVLKSAGPQGGPGMPEWGMLPIPEKLLKQGVRDMLRISDARMSGTAYGTCVLHVSPESHIGGPLALVRDGDSISIDAEARTLNLDITPSEMEARRAAWIPPAPHYTRGYGALYLDHVTQADKGCDFVFLE